MIRLRNPTDESVVLTPHCSNTNNFSLELDNSKQILLAAGSVLEVPLKFTPSAIGNLQSAEVSFHCPQVNVDRFDITLMSLAENTFFVTYLKRVI